MSRARATIAAPALWALLDAAERRGEQPGALLDAVGIDRGVVVRESPVPAAERRVAVVQLEGIWARLMRRFDDCSFPVEVGRQMTPDAFDLFGFLIKTSDTVGEAFLRAERYASIWSDGMQFVVLEEGSRRFIEYRHPTPPTHLGARCAVECVLTEVVGVARAITQEAIPGLEVSFEHARPKRTDAHERYFRAPVSFGARSTGLTIDRSWFERPMPSRDPAMARYFERQALKYASPEAGELVRDVTRRIVDALPSADATIERIARSLGTSARTLRRRLGAEGETFEGVLAKTRHELAKGHLRKPEVSLAEIALLLGFSAQSAFQRAFRRWSGETPGAFRARHATEDSASPRWPNHAGD